MNNTTRNTLEKTQLDSGRSLTQDALDRLKKNRLAMLGFRTLTLLVVISLLTPLVAPYGYQDQNLALGASPPSAAHWLGTDTLGRDLLTRILYGGRVSLLVGFAATAVSLLIGVLWGAVSGFLGGRVDAVMMRMVDILYALPFMILVILMMVVFGRSFLLLFIAIGLVEWLTMARIVRTQVQSIRKKSFVRSAKITGLNNWQIIHRHIIPNVMGPVIVYVTLTIPGVMLFEAFLSFLGLGIQPPQSSWGVLIATGVESMEEHPWLLIFPGLMLSITLFSLNFLGDGLRDALDPGSSDGNLRRSLQDER